MGLNQHLFVRCCSTCADGATRTTCDCGYRAHKAKNNPVRCAGAPDQIISRQVSVNRAGGQSSNHLCNQLPLTSELILKIGRMMAMAMKPTIEPMSTIMIGSIMLVTALMASRSALA